MSGCVLEWWRADCLNVTGERLHSSKFGCVEDAVRFVTKLGAVTYDYAPDSKFCAGVLVDGDGVAYRFVASV